MEKSYPASWLNLLKTLEADPSIDPEAAFLYLVQTEYKKIKPSDSGPMSFVWIPKSFTEFMTVGEHTASQVSGSAPSEFAEFKKRVDSVVAAHAKYKEHQQCMFRCLSIHKFSFYKKKVTSIHSQCHPHSCLPLELVLQWRCIGSPKRISNPTFCTCSCSEILRPWRFVLHL